MELYSFLSFNDNYDLSCRAFKFPSPYGVIFILIYTTLTAKECLLIFRFRLLMELYSFLYVCRIFIADDTLKVSVSLWSYIHSYTNTLLVVDFPVVYKVSVSLWSYIHSYFIYIILIKHTADRFPSPYGVIFILIYPFHI